MKPSFFKTIALGAVVSAAAVLSGPALAAPGDIDPLFGESGAVTTPIESGDDAGAAVAIQPDGKIVVAGSSWNGANLDLALARYDANGSLDTSFDGDGKVTTAIGASNDIGYAVALQADGKIVVAGFSYGATVDFALVRYNPDGSLDTSFDGDGKRTDAIGASQDAGYAVALQPDGKIVVAGSTADGATDLAVVRYNPDGSLDTSFDGDGKRTDAIGVGNDVGYAVALQPDGKIVVAGTADADFALVRYNASGSLDPSFDGDGKRTDAIGASADVGYAVALQLNGKIVVAGYSSNGADNDFALARYNANGSLDTAFDTDGKRTDAIGASNDVGRAVALQPDGKIVVAGFSAEGAADDFALARYNASGSLDTSFDGDGKRTDAIGASEDVALAVALQQDGSIVVAGFSSNGANNDFALARYLGSYPEISIANASKMEGSSGTTNLAFTLSLDVPPGGSPFSIQYRTADWTAVQPDDYAFVSGKLTFSGGQLSKTVTVSVVGDVLKEPSERFYLNLSSPLNGSIFDGSAVGKIVDDDATSVTLAPTAGAPTSSVIVSGSGFAPGEWVDLYFDTLHMRVVVASSTGTFAGATFTVPASTAPGTHWVSAKGVTSGYAAQAAFTVTTDWAQFHNSANRQGFNALENVLSAANAGDLDLTWQANGGGTSSPVVAGGLIFAVGGDAKLRAYRATGALAWGSPAASATSVPAVGGGRIYVSGSNKLTSYNAGTGLSPVSTSGPSVSNSSLPAYASPNVYVGGTSAVYAVNATTGAVVWTGNTAASAVNTAPAVSGSRVFATAANGNLYTYPAACTAVPCLPVSTVAVAATSSPTVVGGILYVGSSDFKLHAFSAACLGSGSVGCELWQSAPTGGTVSSTPAVAGGRVYVGSADKKLYAYPASCSTPCAPLWSASTGGAVSSSPAVAGGVVYVGSADKFLYAFQSSNGALLLSYPLAGALSSSAAISDGRVYVNSSDNKLNAFALPAAPAAPPRPDPETLVRDPILVPSND